MYEYAHVIRGFGEKDKKKWDISTLGHSLGTWREREGRVVSSGCVFKSHPFAALVSSKILGKASLRGGSPLIQDPRQ